MSFPSIEHIYTIFSEHRNICTDTRKIEQSCLFFALKGQNFDGNHYALKAIESGAAYAIVDDHSLERHPQLIFVEDVLTTLQLLARHHRLQSKAKILVITGTNGKTTTKELIAHVLKKQYQIIYTQGNLNNHIGVPLTLLTIQDNTEIAIIEMGANHVGEIASYCSWALPDIGLITNIGKAHLEGFGGIEGVKKAKGELYDFLSGSEKPIFRYTDDTYLTEIGAHLPHTITYGWKDADVTAERLYNNQYAEIRISYPEILSGVYSSQLIGDYNAPNILCAIAVGHYFKIRKEDIYSAIHDYSPKNSRSQLVEIHSNKIILDAYNANPTSMAAAIDHFYHQNYYNKIICLGGMKELGNDSGHEHHVLVEKIKKLNFENVFLVGKEFENHRSTFMYFETSRLLHDHFIQNPVSNSTILIKGSRGSKMEIILDALK